MVSLLDSLRDDKTTLPATLSFDQHDAVHGIVAAHEDGNFAVLEGPAGTGKTFTLEAYRNRNWLANHNTFLSAMTHQAATHLGPTATTVHSALGLVLIEGPDGTRLVPRGKPKVTPGQVLVVDEASMADMGMARWVKRIAIEQMGCKVLYVGDPYQLPPVEGECKIFTANIPRFRLNTIHRQGAGNPIIDLATRYRQAIDGEIDEPEWETALVDGNGVAVADARQFMRLQDHAYQQNVEGTLTVSFTNAAAIAHNTRIRNVVLGPEHSAHRFYQGEMLKANKAITRNGEVLVPNNTRMVAQEVEPHTDDKNVAGYLVTTEFGKLFCPDNIKQVEKFLDKERRKASAKYTAKDLNAGRYWREYCELRDSYVDLRPAYASTVHKAQGSTFSTVFIDLPDIDRCNKDRLRMLYTALTRASRRVVALR